MHACPKHKRFSFRRLPVFVPLCPLELPLRDGLPLPSGRLLGSERAPRFPAFRPCRGVSVGRQVPLELASPGGAPCRRPESAFPGRAGSVGALQHPQFTRSHFAGRGTLFTGWPLGVCVTFALLTLPSPSEGDTFLEPRPTLRPCLTGALFCPAVRWPAKPASRAPVPRRPPEVTEAPKRPSAGNVSGDVFPSPDPCRFRADSVVMVSSCAVKRQHDFQRGRRLVELENLSRFRPVPGSECPCPQKLRSGHPDPQCGGPGRRGVWEVPRS